MRRPRSPALASVLAAVVLLALAVAPADGFVGVRPAGAALRVRLNLLVGGVVLHVLGLACLPLPVICTCTCTCTAATRSSGSKTKRTGRPGAPCQGCRLGQ